MEFATRLTLAAAFAAAVATAPVLAAETPKRGGTLTYLIAADAPPSFDGHREQTYAPDPPGRAVLQRSRFASIRRTRVLSTDFVCDLCTEMPDPDRLRQDLYLQDPPRRQIPRRLAIDRGRRRGELESHRLPARGRHQRPLGELQTAYRKDREPRPETVVFRLKFATSAFLPALADPFNFIYSKEILYKDQHWYEKNIMGSGPFKFVDYDVGQSIKGERNPDYYHKGLPYLDGIVGIFAPKQATRVEAMRGDAPRDFRGLRPRRATSCRRSSAIRSRSGNRLELRQRSVLQS